MGTEIRCGGLLFTSKFDSGNLAAVEKVDRSDSDSDGPTNDPYGCKVVPDYEFNVWTKPDCSGTPFENGNRSWFYFGIRGYHPNRVIKINIVNLNRQGKLYSQGMAPLVRVVPSKPKWERIRDRATYQMVEGQFTLSFTHRFSEQRGGTTYFAFCYPWSYTESQEQLEALDEKFKGCVQFKPQQAPDKTIYYHRETVCYSLDKRKIDLLTITSCEGMCAEREPRLDNLFPEKNVPRAHKFRGKKVYYVSSRVHPGETPASFVFNGFLEFALRQNDARAQVLRDKYVLKLIPMLNPDGVFRGHYRTDQRGVNLNRLYLMPDISEHPSIYASRSLLLFYHHYYRKEDENAMLNGENGNGDVANEFAHRIKSEILADGDSAEELKNVNSHKNEDNNISVFGKSNKEPLNESKSAPFQGDYSSIPSRQSGIAFYVDLHGHASKRGCFIYGNHLENEEDQVDNLLFPKLIALNSAHFDFNGCNFTERNMYLKDKRDGMSKEGSGRVAIFKTLGIIHSYTLECNYNTGRTVNCISPGLPNGRATPPPPVGFPPKYTPEIFESVGRAMAIAGLDFYGCNPWSRLKHSEFTTLENLRNYMLRYVRSSRGNPILPRKMTTRIPINTNSTSTGSSGSSNGNGRNGNNRISVNTDLRKTNFPNGRNNAPTVANGAQNKKFVSATRNQLAPFKSMSSSNIPTAQSSNRQMNRQKTLIRVSVNNTSKHRNAQANDQNSNEQKLKQVRGAPRAKNDLDSPVTLSFTTITNNNKAPNGGQTDLTHSSLAAFPTVVEHLSSEMNEKLLVCLRAMENQALPHSLDHISAPYAPPNLNIPMHPNLIQPLNPAMGSQAAPYSSRNKVALHNLYNQEYHKDIPHGDSRTIKFLNDKQATFLLRKNILLGPNSLKLPSQSQQQPQVNPRLRENGFISPQICRPPSIPSRGKSSLSMYSVNTQSNQTSPQSEQVLPSNNLTNLPPNTGFSHPLPFSHNEMERQLPLTVTRKPIIHSKDENINYVKTPITPDYTKLNTRPTVVNFQGMHGLCVENRETHEKKDVIPAPSRIPSRLRAPRRVSSGNGDNRRGSGSRLGNKIANGKEPRYLKRPKPSSLTNGHSIGDRNGTGSHKPMLNGEAVRLSPRVQKQNMEVSFELPGEGDRDMGNQEISPRTLKSISPTAVNANLMMMNYMPNTVGPK